METFLDLRFLNEQQKTTVLRIPSPKENISANEVSNVMDLIIAKSFSGVTLVSKVDARILTRGTEKIEVAN